MEPIGWIILDVKHNDAKYDIKNRVPPLIGRNGLDISKIRYCNSDINDPKMCTKYSEIFEKTLGTFNNCKITLKVNDATPKFFKARPVSLIVW